MKTYSLTIADDLLIKIFIFIAVITFALIIIAFALSNRRVNKFDDKIESMVNTVRIITVDYKERKVRYFDKFNISNQRIVSLDDFLLNFEEEERVRIDKWLEELLSSKKNVNDYLEVDVIVKKDRRSYYSFLQVQKCDKKKKIIHLESYIMRYLDVKNRLDKKKVSQIVVTNLEQIEMVDKVKNKNKGCFLYVSFKNNKIQDGDEKVDSLYFTNAKNIIVSYLTSNCSVADYSPQSSFTVFYPDISSRRNLLRLMHSLSKALGIYSKIHAYSDKYDYSIAGVLLKDNEANFKKLASCTKSISLTAMKHKDHIMIYDKDSTELLDINDSLEQEFNKFIESKDFKITYQPIVNIQNGRIIAYTSFVECNNTMFSKIQDLKEYAYKNDKGKDLFSMFNKKILTRFKNECNTNVKLVYHISVLERDYVAKSLSHISGLEEEKIILAFDESEIAEWLSDEQDIIQSFENLTKRSYSLALVLDQREMLLTDELMKKFDYFILSSELTKTCKKAGKSLLNMNRIIETIREYKREIIAYDLESTNLLYLFSRMHVKYVTSSLISPKDEMFLPIEQKKLSKILTFLNGKK